MECCAWVFGIERGIRFWLLIKLQGCRRLSLFVSASRVVFQTTASVSTCVFFLQTRILDPFLNRTPAPWTWSRLLSSLMDVGNIVIVRLWFALCRKALQSSFCNSTIWRATDLRLYRVWWTLNVLLLLVNTASAWCLPYLRIGSLILMIWFHKISSHDLFHSFHQVWSALTISYCWWLLLPFLSGYHTVELPRSLQENSVGLPSHGIVSVSLSSSEDAGDLPMLVNASVGLVIVI